MPPRNERVATMVNNEIARNPAVGNDVLVEKARAIDPSVRRLSPRQFHATYRLPALRAAKRSAPKSAAKTAAKSATKKTAKRAAAKTAPTSAPAAAPATETSAPAPAPAPTPTHAPRSTSTAVARPNAAEREAVRGILQTVAREALGAEDRASFLRLLDSLDERAAVILGIFGRA